MWAEPTKTARASASVSRPQRGELLVSPHGVLELRAVRLDRERQARRGSDRCAQQDVVREDEVRRRQLAERRGVGVHEPLALFRRRVLEQLGLHPLVPVEHEHRQQAAGVGAHGLRAAEVELLRVRLLRHDHDVVARAAPLAGDRPRVDVRAGASEQVAVPEQDPHGWAVSPARVTRCRRIWAIPRGSTDPRAACGPLARGENDADFQTDADGACAPGAHGCAHVQCRGGGVGTARRPDRKLRLPALRGRPRRRAPVRGRGATSSEEPIDEEETFGFLEDLPGEDFPADEEEFVDWGDTDDDVECGDADDSIDLGEGDDEVALGDGDDEADGNDGDDVLHGGPGKDRLSGGAGNDAVYGEPGSDTLDGGVGNDRHFGGAGADTVTAGAGKDMLDGGAGKDTLDAGAGNDTIKAKDGKRDVVRCGKGRDTVRADRSDKLTGCEVVKRR